MKSHQKQTGFTLIELLVALAVFAVLGLLVAGALHRAINVHQKMLAVTHRLNQWAYSQAVLRRDIASMQPLSTKSPSNQIQPYLESLPGGGFVLTTASRANPVDSFNRSTLQRVRYRLVNQQLIRDTWPTLDGTDDASAHSAVILDHVSAIGIQYVLQSGQLARGYAISSRNPSLPKGLLIDITLLSNKHLLGVFPVRRMEEP